MSGTAAAVSADEAGGAGGGTQQDNQIDPALEARARRMGWRPRDQYKGRQEWVPADEFVEKAETIMPLLLERNRALDTQVASLTTEMQSTREAMGELTTMARRAEQVGYNRARRELEQRRARAVSEGDTEAFNAVEREIKDLGEPPKEPATRTPPPGNGAAPPGNGAGNGAGAPDPVVAAWVADNPWFRTDPIANAAAVATHGVVDRELPHLSLEERLAETRARMKRAMPHLFTTADDEADTAPPARDNPRRRPPAVSGSQSVGGGRSRDPWSFDAMPKSAQDAWARQAKLIDKGKPFTKEEFAQYYWEDDRKAAEAE